MAPISKLNNNFNLLFNLRDKFFKNKEKTNLNSNINYLNPLDLIYKYLIQLSYEYKLGKVSYTIKFDEEVDRRVFTINTPKNMDAKIRCKIWDEIIEETRQFSKQDPQLMKTFKEVFIILL